MKTYFYGIGDRSLSTTQTQDTVEFIFTTHLSTE